MFPYFYVEIEHLGEIKKFVTCNNSEKNLENELKLEYPNGVILKVKQYEDPEFFIVEPVKVEKGIHGYNLRHHFFKEGVICTDIDENTYFIEYQPYEKEKVVKECDDEKIEIGTAIFTDKENKVLTTIILEDIDEGHLSDRLTAELIKLHESLLQPIH